MSENISPKGEEIAAFTSGLTETMKQLAELDDTRIGVGSTERLDEPISDAFGTYHEKKTFSTGCRLDEELSSPGSIIIKMSTDKGSKAAEIGRTPDSYDPSKGGYAIEGAGPTGEFLLAVKNEDGSQVFRYLRSENIQEVPVEIGKDGVEFSPSQERGSQIHLKGNIEAVIKLR